MIDSTHSSADLFDEVRRRVVTWSPERSQASGLGLLLESSASHSGRMRQARRILATEYILESLVSPARPVMLMKGLEVACLYPSRVERPFRDIDLLVSDPRSTWDELVAHGYRQHPNRRIDIEHHHLPPLADPTGTIGVEVHSRPNLPMWARIPT